MCDVRHFSYPGGWDGMGWDGLDLSSVMMLLSELTILRIGGGDGGGSR